MTMKTSPLPMRKTNPLPTTAHARQSPESDADARFTFANERTLLAWNRTALALVAGGLALAGFTRGQGALLALPLMAFGAFLAFASYRRWQTAGRRVRSSAGGATSRCRAMNAWISAISILRQPPMRTDRIEPSATHDSIVRLQTPQRRAAPPTNVSNASRTVSS
jgi:putative membrane protein